MLTLSTHARARSVAAWRVTVSQTVCQSWLVCLTKRANVKVYTLEPFRGPRMKPRILTPHLASFTRAAGTVPMANPAERGRDATE